MDLLLVLLKNELAITWDEEETNIRLMRIVENAVSTLNFKLGADIDFSEAGMEQELLLNYCVYAWNNCVNQFDENYFNEIMQLRHKYEVMNYEENKDN